MIPPLFLFTGWSAKLRDAAKRMGKAWYPTLVLYLVLFTLITSLITLPLDFWSGFTRQHDYGMSNQTLGKWWKDFGIGMLVSLVLGAVRATTSWSISGSRSRSRGSESPSCCGRLTGSRAA